MPSVSAAQHRYMAMCAHNPGAARGKCPSKAVASEFVHADKGRHFSGKSGRHKKLMGMLKK